MEIFLNGEMRRVQSETVAQLITELELGSKRVAVELNQDVVARTAYVETKINAGDKIEIIHFVGGG